MVAFRVVLPVIQGYEASGGFTSKEKLKESLKSNGLFYLVMIVIGVIVIIVGFIIEYTHNNTETSESLLGITSPLAIFNQLMDFLMTCSTSL